MENLIKMKPHFSKIRSGVQNHTSPGIPKFLVIYILYQEFAKFSKFRKITNKKSRVPKIVENFNEKNKLFSTNQEVLRFFDIT